MSQLEALTFAAEGDMVYGVGQARTWNEPDQVWGWQYYLVTLNTIWGPVFNPKSRGSFRIYPLWWEAGPVNWKGIMPVQGKNEVMSLHKSKLHKFNFATLTKVLSVQAHVFDSTY